MSDLLEEVAGLERALSLLSTSLTPVQYMMLRAVLRAELEGGGILAWGMGLGKCLGLDVPVLTADGSTKLAKDVSIGDLLVGDDGSVRVVLSTVRGKSPMYRVGPTGARAANALESGFTCNDSHQLVFEVGQNSFDKPRLDLPRDAYEVRYLTQKDPQALPTRGSVRLRWGDVPPNKAHAHEAARQLASIHINDYRISQVFSAFKVTRKMDRSLVRAFPYGNDAVRYLPTQADALAAATVGIYESHRSATLRTCTLSASDLYRMASAARANRGTPVENGAVINVDELFPGRLNGFRRPVLHFPQEFNLQHLLNIFFDTQMPEILPRHRLMAERCAWYLGAWLGDGSENRIDTICQSEELFPEMVETFHEIAGSAGLDVECSTQEQNRSAPLYRLIRQDGNRDTNVLWYVARHIGMVQMGGTGSNGHVYGPGEERGHKYIPACLIASSRSVRLHLLAGLIDTDGYYGGDSNGHYEITQKREMLARGIVFLARSLGLKASIHEKWVDYTYNGTTTKGLYFRVVISGMAGSEIPVTIRKKLCQNDGTKRQKNPLHYGVEVERIAEQGEYAGFQIGMLASDHMLPALIDALRLQQATEQKQALLYSMIHDRQLIPSNANGTAVGDRYPGRFLLGDFTVTHNTLVMLLQSVIDHVLWSSKGATARQTLIIGAPALHAVWHQQLRDHVQPGVLTMSQYTDSKQPEAGLSGNIVFCTYTRVLLDAKEHLGTAAPILCNTPVQSLRTREPMCQLKQATDHSMRMIRSPLAKRGLFSKQWHRIVVDEADALRNLKSMRFRYLLGLPATVRWWVTGTPLNNSFADIVSAMLFLREKQVCLELPLQLDPMGLLRGIKNEQEKRSRQSFERRAHVLTAQMVVEDYPHLLEQDPRLQYLSAPVYMFQYAQPFRTEEERQVYKRMQDDLVSVLKELRQCVEQLQLQRQQQASAANAAAAEELGEIQNEHVLAHENEEDMEKEQQQIQDQILHQRPKQQGGGVGGLVQQAVQNVRQSQNPQWAARATVNFFYLRCMQAALLPSFADKPLQDSPNLHYHVQSSTMQVSKEPYNDSHRGFFRI